ncbi:dihydroorotate dehydrogenase electron transfer subunit [uncultured Prevotella sp.]|uniref:dihydroorotate dehydrogenase electron transfer subunit n=1 Tax=uncultured Prevotella sp. TaxID=159272 RepID=UPI0025F33E22|nr:dihydroorotate dehydrogenase electron transfer subunit [uncultured Prevotella sp.]
MKKYILDLQVKSVDRVHERYVLIRLTDDKPLPEMLPGQFVEVRVDGSSTTFLRRPISINFVDRQANELWLLVACVGDGTRRLAELKAGDTLNCVLPLGNGFTLPVTSYPSCVPSVASEQSSSAPFTFHLSPLLVGGGVGVAPLLYLGKVLKEKGVEPTFLLGARSAKDLLMLSEFEKYGRVLVTTEDGTMGEKGFVTNHSVLQQEQFDMIQVCGPTPMMKAVARYANEKGIECEVSLENLMACGLGACLCCVEKTKEGNLCVCKEGPVFNIKRLLWQS